MIHRTRRRVPRDNAELDERLRQAGFSGEEPTDNDELFFCRPEVEAAIAAAIASVANGTEGRCKPRA